MDAADVYKYDLSDTFVQSLFSGDDTFDDCSHSSLITRQVEDPSLTTVRRDLVSEFDSEKEDHCFFSRNGVIMRKWTPPLSSPSNFWEIKYQIVIPTCYRKRMLFQAHDSPLSGHLGVTKTLSRIRNYFFWPGMRKDVEYYCKTCETCQRVGKPNQVIPIAPLIPIPVLDPPFTRILMDIVGPLPSTRTGHKYLLTLMDLSTRFPEAFPLKETSASTPSA